MGWTYLLQPMVISGLPLKTAVDLQSGLKRRAYSRQSSAASLEASEYLEKLEARLHEREDLQQHLGRIH